MSNKKEILSRLSFIEDNKDTIELQQSFDYYKNNNHDCLYFNIKYEKLYKIYQCIWCGKIKKEYINIKDRI